MRPTLSVFIATSLDGFIARRNGDIDWLTAGEPAQGDFGYQAFFDTVDTLVMGRGTYEKVLTFGQWPYDDRRLIVLSTRGTAVPPELAARVEVSALPPAQLVRQLEQDGARHVYVDGGRTIQSFLRAGLLDELTITVIPILLGDGLPLFGPLEGDVRLVHMSTHAFENGFVQSRYRLPGRAGRADS